MERKPQTARYQIIPGPGGNRYRFFCDLSGAALCFTKPVRGESAEAELLLAWESEGRRHFNHCHRCGRWVSDVMYNADELCCVDCAPWRPRPRFCSHCGARLEAEGTVCPRCGRSIEG